MPWTPSPRGVIGCFESVEGAALAVSHLVALHHDPADLAIAPRAFEVVDSDCLRVRVRRGARRGAAASALVVGGLAVATSLGLDTLARWVLPLILLAAIIGGGVGLMVAVIQHRRARTTTFTGKPPELRPTVFDVVVDGDADGARFDLARWWDPAAPPVQRDLAA